MMIEKNSEAPATQVNKNNAKKRNKRKSNPKKNRVPSVIYAEDELVAVEGKPFWNCVHSAKVKTIDEDGMTVGIKKDDSEIEAQIAKEEICIATPRSVGDEISVYLEDRIDSEANGTHPFKASEIKAVELGLLERARAAKENNEKIPGFVVGTIKGGYSVALFADSREKAELGFGLRAFLPFGRTGLRRNEGLSSSDDHLVNVHITELEPGRGNIVVSRREVLQESRKQEEESFFTETSIGDRVKGKVTAIMPYGIFVNLGAVDGFLHISDLSWDRKPRLKDFAKVGDEIEAAVIEIDKEKSKIKLSVKQLNPDPWQEIDKHFRPGSEVDGTIVAFAEFGAFVKLNNGVEGLIHLGEITWNRIKHPSQHFKIGDSVRAAVLRIDKEERRISLSTKTLEVSPVERLSSQFPIGSVIKTKISSIHDFGLFVSMDEKNNGLVPRSEISWVRNDLPLEKQFNEGEDIEVAVLGYDSKRQRVSCSIKRLIEDPWPKWKQKFKKGSIHKVKVQRINKMGIVCELDGDLSGFCPKGQLSESASESGRIQAKAGDEIEVIVTACDPLRQRISLSQRALIENETKKAYQSYLSEQGKSGKDRTTLGDALKNFEIKKN